VKNLKIKNKSNFFFFSSLKCTYTDLSLTLAIQKPCVAEVVYVHYGFNSRTDVLEFVWLSEKPVLVCTFLSGFHTLSHPQMDIF